MSLFRITAHAARDLDQIIDFYAVIMSNPAAALRVAQGILESCRRAGLEPEIGRVRPELGDGIRVKVVRRYPYNVFYFYLTVRPRRSERVPILRVLHQRRKVDRAAFQES